MKYEVEHDEMEGDEGDMRVTNDDVEADIVEEDGDSRANIEKHEAKDEDVANNEVEGEDCKEHDRNRGEDNDVESDDADDAKRDDVETGS